MSGGMSRPKAQENWKRLIREFNLSRSEQQAIHRHLDGSYSLEKNYMSYDKLKRAAREVVNRI